MMKRNNPAIDQYISKAQPFAQPVLKHFRSLVHKACPEVTETMKWSFPHFEHKGVLCSMAAFKRHCAIGFWKGELIFGKENPRANEAMGHLGRITSLSDLPPDKVLLGYIKEAARLNEAGIKRPVAQKQKRDLVIPNELVAALRKNRKAAASFEALSPSHKREYAEWIAEAKREETRLKRVKTALQWLSEGKSLNWKHER